MELGTIATVIGTGIGTVGLVYQIMRNFKEDVKESLERYDKRFELMERRFDKRYETMEMRFEKMDQRLFLLCLGKDLPSILKSEKEDES